MKHTPLVIRDASAINPYQLEADVKTALHQDLAERGYCLLRGINSDVAGFSQLARQLCRTLTLDPARQSTQRSVQKVDAGAQAIGLHVENGNTPRIPQLVAFYCAKAAQHGSQTTLCDGQALFNALDSHTQQRLQQPLDVTRTLPEPLWKAYLANEHPKLSDSAEIEEEHLWQMIQAIPGQRAHLNDDHSLEYTVTVSPILRSQISQAHRSDAFANAILGPSFNYQAPVYTFADGSGIDEAFKQSIAQIAEPITHEIAWQDGDIALIDNHRVMHGRRAITDAARRELYIAMGDF